MTRSEWYAGVLKRMNEALAWTRVVPFRIKFFAALLALSVPAQSQAQYRTYSYPQQPQVQYQVQPQCLPCEQVRFGSAGTVISVGQPVFNIVPSPAITVTPAAPTFVHDFLAEVNAKRASRGLRPYIHDHNLTIAAQGAAQFRAQNGMFGHTSNDFAFLPRGASAASAGCAAYPASFGWMSCDVYDNYTYAGAYAVTGRDGKRYMHLFVR